MRQFRFLAFTILLTLYALGCSTGNLETSLPLNESDFQPTGSSAIIDRGTIEFDAVNQTVGVVPDRESDIHFNITGFIRPYFSVAILDFQNGVFTVEMTIENPTAIQVWDVRIYFMDLAEKKVLNPDGYSDYYTNVVFVPFINFVKEDPERAFPLGPGGVDSEILILDFNNAPSPVVYYIIEAGLGSQHLEPVQVDKPQTHGIFLSNSPKGGSVSAYVLDHQSDAIVTVDATQIGLSDSEPMFDDGLHNDMNADDGIFGSERLIPAIDPGNYTLVVKAADPLTYPTIIHPVDIKVYPSAEMILIPAGEFTMGISEQDPYYDQSWAQDEKPQHQHSLDAYYIGKYEVTVGEYAAFVEDDGYYKRQYWSNIGWAVREDLALLNPIYWYNLNFCGPSKLDHPMIGLCWYEVEAYINWLVDVTGLPYHLPSEPQWERASRGDTDDRVWPWGYSWDKEKCNNSQDTIDTSRTSPVGLYSPAGDSPWGCADVAGNALEWTKDWYKSDIYTQYSQGNYTPPASGTRKVMRGGVWWYNNNAYFRCTFRWDKTPIDFDDGNGFRLARNTD